jgi:hypothetical protein
MPAPTMPTAPPASTGDRDIAAVVLVGVALAGLAAVLVTSGEPLIVLAIPAAVPVAIASARWPVATISVLALCASAYGALLALTPIPALKLADGLLAALWLGVVIAFVRGRRERPVYPPPALLLVFAYIAISALALVTGSFDAGIESFRLTAAHLSIVGLVAIAPWDARTYRMAGQALLVVSLLVGGYCLLRYATGATAAETALARATFAGLPTSTELRFFGSFPSAQELTVWAAGMLPFGVAVVLCVRGRWRWVALATVALCLIALLAADVRTGIVAAVAGLVVTVVLFMGSQALPSGTRVGAAFTGVLLVVALGGAAYFTAVSGSPTREERLSALLDPSEDRNFQIRTERWELAWQEIKQEPFGHGLGTAGTGSRSEAAGVVGPEVLDSSYLKIGIEQGIPVMVLFAAMLAALLISLAWRSISGHSPGAAVFTIGAAGTLTSLAVLFYGSSYVESPSILPAWIVVGLGVAMLAGARSEDFALPLRRPAGSARRPPGSQT